MQRWMRGPKRRGQGMQGRRFASTNRARARCTLLDASENKCRFVPVRGSTHRSHQFAFRRSRFSRNGSLFPPTTQCIECRGWGIEPSWSQTFVNNNPTRRRLRTTRTSEPHKPSIVTRRWNRMAQILPFLPSIRPLSSAVGGTTCKMRLYMLGHILVVRDMHDKLTYSVRWSSFGARQAIDRSRDSRLPVTRVRDAFGKWRRHGLYREKTIRGPRRPPSFPPIGCEGGSCCGFGATSASFRDRRAPADATSASRDGFDARGDRCVGGGSARGTRGLVPRGPGGGGSRGWLSRHLRPVSPCPGSAPGC